MKLQNKKLKKIWIFIMGVIMCVLLCGCARAYTYDEETTPLETESIEAESVIMTEQLTTAEQLTTTVQPTTTVQETTQEETTMAIEETKNNGYYGALHVEHGKLCDEDGNAVALKGISTAGLQWFPQYVNKETFAFLKEATGMNVIRLAMYTAEGGYCHNDVNGKMEMEALIDKGVKAATELDLYVVIDWHILSDNNPNNYKEEAKEFFDKMSKQYSEYDNVIYEICNEPNGGTSWDDIKRYANEVIPAIRNNDKDAVILVGTPTWSQDIDKAMNSPLEFDNIMYTFHFYASTHKGSLRNRLKTALDAGIPVFVSEFGVSEASGDGEINAYEAEQWHKLMEDYGLSYCIWNLSNKNESSSIVSAGCNKTAGWNYDEWSVSGKWFLRIMGK